MAFHPDASLPDRHAREPYGPPDYCAAFYYLSDTNPRTPAFCVVPGSMRCRSLSEAREVSGDWVAVPGQLHARRLNGRDDLAQTQAPHVRCSGGPTASSLSTARRCGVRCVLFLAADFTEIYLCDVCPYQEMLRRNGRG
eukprot:COSAG01_NODE_1770_length_9272_cov_5.371198_7_plen_139_part_00